MRDKIIDAATRLFSQRGFDGTSLQDIADAVGIRKASLFHHFPNKEDIRLKVLDQLLSHWNEVVPQILAATSRGVDQSDAIIQEATTFFLADPDRARFLTREVLDSADGIKSLLTSHLRPWFAVLCEHIRRGQRAGRVYDEVDPEAYLLQMINLVVCCTATLGVLGPLIETEDGDRNRFLHRHVKELLRISRASLFKPIEDKDNKKENAPAAETA